MPLSSRIPPEEMEVGNRGNRPHPFRRSAAVFAFPILLIDEAFARGGSTKFYFTWRAIHNLAPPVEVRLKCLADWGRGKPGCVAK